MSYKDIFKDRINVYKSLKSSFKRQSAFKLHYKDNIQDYINDWGVTYDPRNDGIEKPKLMPFMLYKRQIELIEWYDWLIKEKLNGAIDKSRDTGCTYVASGYSVGKYLFEPGFKIGFGSRKASLVDTIGDPDSIFEKLRIIINNTPYFFLPKGLDTRKHLLSMRCLNPETGASIIGEGGDEIGRGGRTSMYFKDESAFYEHPEKIEAALGENTNIQVDISTHNGTNTIFYEATQNYPDKQVFVFDWFDIPWKTQEWYEKQKEKYRLKGLNHLFAQEVDRDPGATLQNVVIPKAWVDCAVDAHLKIDLNWFGRMVSGLDVADDGTDANAQIIRNGLVVEFMDDWVFNDLDTAITTRKAIENCNLFNCTDLNYDAVGVGAGVKATSNELYRANKLKIKFNPFKGSYAVDNPKKIVADKLRNEQVYSNLKSQYWWELRLAFENTYKALNGKPYDKSNVISLSSKIPKLSDLKRELSQAQYKHNRAGQIEIEKKGNGKKSPNKADALVIAWRTPNFTKPIAIPLKKKNNPRSIYT